MGWVPSSRTNINPWPRVFHLSFPGGYTLTDERDLPAAGQVARHHPDGDRQQPH